MDLRIFVTSVCNRRCKDCSQDIWKTDHPGFHLSEKDLLRFLSVCVESKYTFDRLMLAGGEPSLWKNFSLIRKIKESGICRTLFSYTNAKDSKAIQNFVEHKDCLDRLSLSLYEKNSPNVKYLLDELGDIVFLDPKEEFWEIPDRLFPKGTPGICGCHSPAYWGGDRVWYCPTGWNVASKFGLTLPSVSLKVGWLEEIRKDYGGWKGCSGCVSNRSIRKFISLRKREDGNPKLSQE